MSVRCFSNPAISNLYYVEIFSRSFQRLFRLLSIRFLKRLNFTHSNVEGIHSKTYRMFIFSYFNHSHKKRKDRLETRTVLIEISLLSWNLPSGSKHRGSIFYKNGFLWRESAICRWYSCFSRWSKRWYASLYKEVELEMDCLTSRILLQKVSSYKYQLCTKVCFFKAGLSSLSDGWAKNKEKVPDVSHSNQNIQTQIYRT